MLESKSFAHADDDQITYKVVVNAEEQYSIWPSHRSTPSGWTETGATGAKSECLEWINRVWTDIRPLSLRKALEADGADRRDVGPGDRPDPLTPRMIRVRGLSFKRGCIDLPLRCAVLTTRQGRAGSSR